MVNICVYVWVYFTIQCSFVIFRCLARLRLLLAHKENIVESPLIRPLNRNNLGTEQTNRRVEKKDAGFRLKSGKVIRSLSSGEMKQKYSQLITFKQRLDCWIFIKWPSSIRSNAKIEICWSRAFKNDSTVNPKLSLRTTPTSYPN